jgi:hypothetical protein
MFRRIRNSWELLKASLAVLRADKELILFPIVSAIGVVLVTATFFVPLTLAGFLDGLLAGGLTVLGFVALFLFYLVQYFVILFCNAALVGAAMVRLRGGNPTVGDGFRVALEHTGPILGYAVISATVGVVLRMLTERAGGLGRLVVSLVGLAWNVATFLVVPVLVVEGIGGIFGLFALLVAVAGLVLITLAGTTNSVALLVAAVVAVILALLFLGLVSSAVNGIYAAAVYRYAVTGETGGFYRQELVEEAFRRR